MLHFVGAWWRRHRRERARDRLRAAVERRTRRLMTHLAKAALNNPEPGVGNDCSHDIVVSLTSHGTRIRDVHLAVESLMRQRLRPDRIVLCLHREERALAEGSAALQRQRERGLEILYCPRDLGPYTKYYYTMQRYPQSMVITVDDDVIYPRDMVDRLYRAYCREPGVIHCHRAHRMLRRSGRLRPYKRWDWNTQSRESSLDIFPTGVGGVLYFPGSLHPDAFSADLFAELSPRADDVWLKAMSMLQGTPCSVVPRFMPWGTRFCTVSGSQATALKRRNKSRLYGNDACLARTLAWYGLAALWLCANLDDVNSVILNKLLSLGLVT